MITMVEDLVSRKCLIFFFFFNDTATTEIYTLSLHDALPIFQRIERAIESIPGARVLDRHIDPDHNRSDMIWIDRKSTRLNSSHLVISYAVFCLKKKNNTEPILLDA